MSNLTLDGSTSFIGTEFIKLLATGSSNLATVQYVDDAIAEGGGGGVQPEDVYTKAEADALLNAKLNVNNPQNITGNLRLDPTNGLSKIILNAVGVPNDEDFYVNGNGYINGEMRASSMKCDNTLTFATIKGNFISNNDTNPDLKFQINSNDFITLSTANDVIEVDKDIEMHSSVLKSNVLDTWSNTSLEIRRNGTNYLSLDGDDTLSISRQSKIGSNKADGVDMTVSHYNNTTNLFEKKLSFKNGNEFFATGDGGVDEELLLNYYTDAGVRIGNSTDAYLTIKGARNGTDTLTVNGSTYFGGAVTYNGDIVIADSFQLKTDTISSNGLNDLVSNVDTLGEFFRFQISDFTVRVPNNNSFLSQNIFTDIIKPIAFTNDVSLQGKNTTNDGYEEYCKINSTTETVDFNKTIDTSGDILMNLNKRLYLDDSVSNRRYIVSTFRSGTPSFNQLDIVNENSTNGRIGLMIGTEENLIVENSQLYSKRVITAVAGVKGNLINTYSNGNLSFQRNDIEYLRFDTTNDNITCSKEIVAGGGIKNNTFDSDGNSNVIFKRNDTTYMTFETDRVEINQELHLANALIIDTVNKLTMRPSLETGVNIFDIRNLHPVVNNPMIRFRVGQGGGETIVCEMREEYVSIARNVLIGTAYKLQTNTIDSNSDNDVLLQRNGTTKLELNTNEVSYSTDLQMNTNKLKFNDNNIYIRYIVGGDSSDIFDFVNTSATTPRVRYLIGGLNSSDIIMQLYTDKIDCQRNVELGIPYQLKCNTINTNGSNDMVFQIDGTEILKFRASDSLILGSDASTFSSPKVYSNEFLNRTLTFDTVFYGANATSDGRVEYMKWNRSAQQLDFNAPIDNTGIAIIGNIVDTTVSDERLKTNIQDVESNFTECVKNVKVKTFEYTDEKYKNNDKYGFIAQELQEHLPKEFNHIVKENKEKNSDDKYLSINYMKVNLLLWGALQETLTKVEHLESSVYELQEELKDVKKPKPKSKAKAKAEKIN